MGRFFSNTDQSNEDVRARSPQRDISWTGGLPDHHPIASGETHRGFGLSRHETERWLPDSFLHLPGKGPYLSTKASCGIVVSYSIIPSLSPPRLGHSRK